jgi:hypothetical protein
MFKIVQLKFVSRKKVATDGTYFVASVVVLGRGRIGVFVLLVYDGMSQKNGRLNHTAPMDKIISLLCALLYWKKHRQILFRGFD